jgi:RNA polymerase sigma factor
MFQRPEQPEQLVARIQAGEEELREGLISGSIPEIRHLIRRITHSWLASQEDEFSIALQAFNQAINRYQPDTGAPFFSYAYLLIRHRLLDWIRQQRGQPTIVSLSSSETDGDLPLADQLADPRSGQTAEELEVQESLLQLDLALEQFGYSIPALTRQFPKHQDSQALCIHLSRLLAQDEPLCARLMEKKRLPCAELAQRSGTAIKTIEKNRANIIFLTLLLRSDLQVIQSYVTYFEKEASS